MTSSTVDELSENNKNGKKNKGIGRTYTLQAATQSNYVVKLNPDTALEVVDDYCAM